MQTLGAQEQEPPPEGLAPENAKHARIAHTLGGVHELPASYTGPQDVFNPP